ncbi:Oligopeptide transporter 1 [Linum perenne]
MIDPPRGWFPDAPGHMMTIFLAAVMRRVRKGFDMTDVFLHDVIQKVDKKFAEEFQWVSESQVMDEHHHSFDASKLLEENDNPIEEVRLTVSTTDDPTLPALTFRTWVLGLLSCVFLSVLNQFFGYRYNGLYVGSTSAQILMLPLGQLMAATLPTRKLRVPLTKWSFTLNPGPFNVKEHVLITILANCGADGILALAIVTAIRAFYHRSIHIMAAFLLVLSTQLLGYGWAGIFRKILVDSPHMWWPGSMPQKSITAQQIGSGLNGLGIGSFGLDWSTIAGFVGSPLSTPLFAILNTMAGFFLFVYVILPTAYWNNAFNARSFPMLSQQTFDSSGQLYNITRILNQKEFSINLGEYEDYSKLYLSFTFAFNYGISFAAFMATLVHVALFDGQSIWELLKRASSGMKDQFSDVHTRMMKKNYEAVPQWWFLAIMVVSLALSFLATQGFNRQLQLPWWGLILSCAIAFAVTLPTGILVASANQGIGINIITELIIGYLYPGRPVANVAFKTYGTISMWQSLSFLSDFKLGHYMKVPPKSMFKVQLVGTLVASVVQFGTTWWILSSIKDICDTTKLPKGSPWTCPGYDVFYSASIIWGVVGPLRIFNTLGVYPQMNWFFLVGTFAPVPVWLLSRKYPEKKWIRMIYMPIILSGMGGLLPAKPIHYLSWGAVGVFFNYYVYNKHKGWWARHTYILSAAMDVGIAFMGLLLYVSLQRKEIYGPKWWGLEADDHCPLAKCPTDSITAQQIGSGLNGLGIGSFGLDWSTVAGFDGNPLATPLFAILNTMAGQPYNITRILNQKEFSINVSEYQSYSKLYLSFTLAFNYGISFASLMAAFTHVALYDRKSIWEQLKRASSGMEDIFTDIHTRLMKRNYEAVPEWWFLVIMIISLALSFLAIEGFNKELQLPWWALILACAIAFAVTLPVGIIVATANQGIGLNVLTELIIGYLYPGRPLANLIFKTYGTISMEQALSFLSDFKLGHYMKIPPKSMFVVQFATTWWILLNVENICDIKKLPKGSPWTCPGDDIFYSTSIIWGVVGPLKIFNSQGVYPQMNWFFLIGTLAPIPGWMLSRKFPEKKWIRLIYMPVFISGMGGLLPAKPINYLCWGGVGVFFNCYIYNKYKGWWARHTYILSAALDLGIALLGLLIYITL